MTASAPGSAPPPARTAPSAAASTTSPTQSTAAVTTTAAGTPNSRLPARNPSTPKLMLGMMTLCVVLVALFTAVAVVSLAGARSELSGAGRSVDELGRVYAIQTELLRADAAAAHGLLTVTAETDPRSSEALGHARVLVVEAAEAEPRDSDALAEVNRRLDDYVAALERARMAAGTPAAATALGEAGDRLRSEVIPPLTELTSENSQRVAAQTRGFPGYLLVATGVLAVAALLALTVLAAIRFRRVLNLGILAAIVLVIASIAVSGTVLLRTHEGVNDTGRRAIPVLGTTAEARTHGYDAHAQEALVVLAQNSSPAAQEPWDTAAAETAQALERPVLRNQHPDLHTQWAAYEGAHDVVREHALAGRWDAARSAAVESGRVFAEFDAAAAAVMTDTAATVQQELSQPRLRLLQGAVLSALAGLAAVTCMVTGLRPRLREYR